MTRSTRSGMWVAAVLTLGLLAIPAGAAGPGPLAVAHVTPVGIEWQPAVQVEKMVLTVSGPGDLILRREFAGDATPVFEAFVDGKPLPDGMYTYELVAAPVLDRETRQALARAHATGDDAVPTKLRAEGKVPSAPLIQSGSFMVRDGALVPQDLTEAAAPRTPKQPSKPTGLLKDVVTPDDSIIQGSLCVGLDCVNNESFGFDTIRLKENNTRIKFDDTSTSAGFSANDWQLTANDSASGGSSKFSIEDITGSKVPFTITGGAATNSIFVDSTGRVGLRTSTPVLDLHINTSNTPAIRLEQNNSGGFTAQTWDIAGNEANFFVRDVTGGSRLPFRIRPGAPTSSIDINASGDVGIGTASPSNSLHVLRSDGTAKLFIQESSGTTTDREIAEFRNNGGSNLILKDSSRTERWAFGLFTGSFILNEQVHAGVELTLTSAGNMTIAGTLTQGSSRDIKTDFATLDAKDVLSRVNALPVSLWSYKTDQGVRHIGPMAEDFHQAFGLGADDKHIAPGDQAGVALLAVQGLNQVVQEKDREIAELKSRIDALEKLVQGLAQKAPAEPQH